MAFDKEQCVDNSGRVKRSDTSTALVRGCATLLVFFVAALLVGWWRGDIRYVLLFSGIGLLAGTTEFLMGCFPRHAQLTRRVTRFIVASFLVSLALIVGINFQFSGVFFDLYEGVVTGALIQLVVARIIIPFVLGNAFCSRACWNGAVFEFLDAIRGANASSGKEPFTLSRLDSHLRYRTRSRRDTVLGLPDHLTQTPGDFIHY